MRTFINFYIALQFLGHLLQELDGQTQCDHFGENFMKISWMMSKIFTVFSDFPGDTFSTWKMETKLCDNLHSCRSLLKDLEYRDKKNPQKKSQISQTVLEHFPPNGVIVKVLFHHLDQHFQGQIYK